MAIKQTGQKNISNRKLARLFGVDESTVRYHVARGNTTDARKNKPQKADQLADVIAYWLDHNKPEPGRKPIFKLMVIKSLDVSGSELGQMNAPAKSSLSCEIS